MNNLQPAQPHSNADLHSPTPEVQNLSEYPSLITLLVNELRTATEKDDRVKFRADLRRLGALMAQELSKTLAYKAIEIPTPLGVAQSLTLAEPIVVATVLRAGLPFQEGFLDAFPTANAAFVSAFRRRTKEGAIEAVIEYMACSSLADVTLLMVDPMLATGRTGALALRALLASKSQQGQPKAIHFCCALASPQGIAYIQQAYPQAQIWAAVIDEGLDAKQYIVPGLGDAGDLAFGPRV